MVFFGGIESVRIRKCFRMKMKFKNERTGTEPDRAGWKGV